MESMAEGMIKDLVASGHALADDMTGAPSVLVRCLAAQLEVQLVRANALAAENAYLLNGAARELNTSWMFHKTMLGAQAALVCLSHGYQAAAREWLEGTTDEAGAEIPDDISVGELHEWFDRQMVSNDGKSGFLTRSEAEEAIRKACPATDTFLAEVRNEAGARAVELFSQTLGSPYTERDEKCYEDGFTRAIEVVRDVQAPRFAAQLRKGVAQ